jgi:DNA-directed RNA polymerase subunit N (RpoN/RPB10)
MSFKPTITAPSAPLCASAKENIRCFTCRRPLSHIRPLYLFMLESYMHIHPSTKKAIEDSSMKTILENNQSEIFETLNIYNFCCRARLTQTVSIEELLDPTRPEQYKGEY